MVVAHITLITRFLDDWKAPYDHLTISAAVCILEIDDVSRDKRGSPTALKVCGSKVQHQAEWIMLRACGFGD